MHHKQTKLISMKKVMKVVAAIMLMAAVICAAGCKKEDIDDPINGHGYVDLGLPSGTLWATCNVGADVPEDYGDYFAWGETQPKSIYNWETYKYGRENKLTKYCTNSDYGLDGFVDGLFVLLSADDASTVNWGEGWHIPTVSEWDEMVDNCSQKAARLNGVKGIRYTGPNGNSIFLPFAGYRWEGDLFYNGEYGLYWSNQLNKNEPNIALFYRLNWVPNDKGDNYCRSNGRSIRPVRSSSFSGQLPQVTTSEVSVFYNNSAVCGGNVISDGGSTVTERGVCWSTSPSPTINGDHASAGSGIGEFSVLAPGIIEATTYYARAYAINGVGIAYGNQVEFMMHQGGGGGGGTGGECPEGGINALFTINEDGDKVYFSQGNLQYQASTNTWRFAEHQWDYVGEGNNNISPNYNGWIDLFGWGTSGWNNGNTYYHPWDYLDNGNASQGYGYGPTDGSNFQYSLIDDYANADWGVYNMISNGGTESGVWHTMTSLEWEYLFFIRNTTTGARYAKANVNGINGVILLPDDWSSTYYTLNAANQIGAGFNSNVITISQWLGMEQCGAVFLPVAGYRHHNSTEGQEGYYWTTTSCGNDEDNACAMYLEEGSNLGLWCFPKYSGRSVRLVQDATNGSGSGNGGGGRK